MFDYVYRPQSMHLSFSNALCLMHSSDQETNTKQDWVADSA